MGENLMTTLSTMYTSICLSEWGKRCDCKHSVASSPYVGKDSNAGICVAFWPLLFFMGYKIFVMKIKIGKIDNAWSFPKLSPLFFMGYIFFEIQDTGYTVVIKASPLGLA